jgi:hypothetical protein
MTNKPADKKPAAKKIKQKKLIVNEKDLDKVTGGKHCPWSPSRSVAQD